MSLNLPRVGEILAGAFGALLAISLILPWYRTPEPATAGCDAAVATCPRETLTAFEAFAALDLFLLALGLAGIGLLVAELTGRTSAVPVAWASLLSPLAVIAAALVLWRTLAPPGGSNDDPLFALLGLVASVGLAAGSLLSMRNEGLGSRGGVRRRGPQLADPEPQPAPPAGGSGER